MLVTPLGIATLNSFSQSTNANEPMLVTLSGIVMEERLEQFENVFSSIALNPLGRTMDVSPHREKARLPISMTVLGMLMRVSFAQDWKALRPMLVTPVGRVTDDRDMHDSKALFPMVVTPLGMLTEYNLLHP